MLSASVLFSTSLSPFSESYAISTAVLVVIILYTSNIDFSGIPIPRTVSGLALMLLELSIQSHLMAYWFSSKFYCWTRIQICLSF